ncbi:TPA: ABC transporter ATP-binding protein [Staphylococcus aureus]|nr:ABC transporter ATP-binding protein [Staphylococcus aureus]
MTERILEVNDLHVSFDITAGEVQAVRGVDFYLNKGETLAIVGESGSGKSVTTKAITKLFQGDTGRIKKGEILFLGEDLAKKPENELIKLRGKDISMIFQDPMTSLNPTMQAQILDLMKELQKKIDTAIIFITHDLGVVANIADRVAVMYGGQMVETGDVNEIFYDPKHPYTWGLLSSMPDLSTTNDTPLLAIPGAPPDLLHPPKGDAFARRSQYALDIDFKVEPPWFKVSPTHFVKSWLLDARAPKVELPELVKQRMKPMPNNYEKPLKVERVSFNEK